MANANRSTPKKAGESNSEAATRLTNDRGRRTQPSIQIRQPEIANDEDDQDAELRHVNKDNRLVREVAGIYVPHPAFVSVLDRVKETIDELHGCSHEPPCLHIGGPSGVGKSTLLRKLQTDYPRIQDGIKITHPLLGQLVLDHAPVVFIRMPTAPTMISVGQRILEALGYPMGFRGGKASVEGRVDMLLKRCGTRALIIDEAQRLADRGGVVRSFDVVDWLRDRAADTGVVLVLVGLGRMVEVIAQDEQFERRYDAGLRMQAYPWVKVPRDEVPDDSHFHSILLTFKELVPWLFGPDIDVDHTDDEVAWRAVLRFHYASRGLIGHLMHLLKHCAQIASRKTDAELRVDLSVVHEAFERGFDYRRKGMVNPFTPDWDPVEPPAVLDDRIMSAPARKRRFKTTQGQRRRRAIDALSKR